MNKIKQFISTNRKFILQLLGFTIGYLITKSILFIFLILIFTILFIFSKEIYDSITNKIEFIIGIIGKTIKSFLFVMLYIFIMIPISIIQRIATKENKTSEKISYYIEIDKRTNTTSFKKMW